MKITPLAGSGVLAGSQQSTSPDRREAAKRAFNGESPISLKTSDTPIDPDILAKAQNIRKIQMRTNASPDRIEGDQFVETNQESILPDNTQETVTDEVTKPLSPQFAALAKQRRAIQVKEMELAAKEKALLEGPKGIDLSRLKAEPLSVLQEAGVTYEQLTEAILANPSTASDAKILALESKLAELEKGVDSKLSDRDQQAEQAVLKELRRTVDKFTFSGDEFENIREDKAQGRVVELIHRTWKQTGEVLDEYEAAQLVENELISDYEKRARRKSIMSRLTPQEQVAQGQQAQRQMRTLTNRDTASPQISKRARAMAAFHGTLKK